MESQVIEKGILLVSRPMLGDFVFNRSVVLITEHNHKGSIGFVINKPLGNSLCDYISDVDCDFPVFDGGPVEQESIYYLHSRPDLIQGSQRIFDDLYWSGDFEDVRFALKADLIKEHEIRFYLGYSGWGPRQIKKELKLNAWRTLEDKINIFEKLDTHTWRNKMQQLGGENLLWVNTPEDPMLN